MPRKQKKYHYIYKTTNTINNKYYIGMHSTNDLNDGYVGSGKLLWRSINKHGKENHKTEILEYLFDRKQLIKREKEIVDKDLLNEKMCMNLVVGGQGGGSWQKVNQNSELQRQKQIKSQIRQNWLRENDTEWVRNKAEKLSKSGKLAYAEGRNTSTPPDWSGKKHTEKAKRNISNAKKGKHIGKKNSQYGTRWSWVHKNGIVKKVELKDSGKYFSAGWKKGTKEKAPKINVCEKCNTEFETKKKSTKYCTLKCRNLSKPNKVVKNFQKLKQAYKEHGTLCKAFNVCGINRSKTRYDTFYKLLEQNI